jgi:hypothetical protein
MDTATVTEISSYIRDNRDTPFEWGSFDCCVFVATAIKIQTKIDVYKPYSGKYKTEIGAAKALKRYGSIEDTLDKYFERINPALAGRGDVHMLSNGIMALQFSGGKWATTESGVSIVNEESTICWRIK